MMGFAIDDTGGTGTQAGITTAYAVANVILLHLDADQDARSGALPSAGYLSHLDLKVLATAGSPANVDAWLSWDAAGDHAATGEFTDQVLVAALTTANTYNTRIVIDHWYKAPSVQTTKGKLYLWVKFNAGTVTVQRARLYWSDNLAHGNG